MNVRFFLLILFVTAASAYAEGPTSHFVFVHINDQVMPIQRAERYEDPVHAGLTEAGLGGVTGGGSALNEDGSVSWVGVDVELTSLDEGVPYLLEKLRLVGVPAGSFIEYESQGHTRRLNVH